MGSRDEDPAKASLHLEVSVRRTSRAAARKFGNYRRRPQRETTPRGDQETEVGAGGQNPGDRFFSKCLAQSQGGSPADHRTWRHSIYDVDRKSTRLNSSHLGISYAA